MSEMNTAVGFYILGMTEPVGSGRIEAAGS